MSDNTIDQLYGNKGIDTKYEHELITYRPDLSFSRDDINVLVRPEVQQSIERSKTFTISHNLSEYDELIAEVNTMLEDIKARNQQSSIEKLHSMLSDRQTKEIIAFERNNSGYQQTGDYELYSLLFNMKESMSTRRDFIDEKYRTQITSETDIEKIQEAELSSISGWEQLEAGVIQGYKNLAEVDEEDSFEDPSYLSYERLEQMDKQKRNKELFHTTLADTSYIHRNRYFMFLEIVEKAKILTYQSNSLVDSNLKDLILSLSDMSNVSGAKAHMVLQFRKIRDKHDSMKGRMMTIDDEKETFASEKGYMYQQLESKTIEPIKTWLYDQEEGYSGSLDKFSSIMVNSIKESRNNYEETLADMLNFYKSEADFYEQQIHFMKEKEEIRKFYRILEDLEEAGQIGGEWVEEYLKANGYTV
jgi:hypothetical protein